MKEAPDSREPSEWQDAARRGGSRPERMCPGTRTGSPGVAIMQPGDLVSPLSILILVCGTGRTKCRLL